MKRPRSRLPASVPALLLVCAACADLPRSESRPAAGAADSGPDAKQPVHGLWVQVGHSTPWTWPAGTTKIGSVAPPGRATNDAYIGLRLKATDVRSGSDFPRGVLGGTVGGEAASWTSDILVRLRVQKDEGEGWFARPGEDFDLYATSPARNANAVKLTPIAGGDGHDYEVRIPAGRPGVVAWVGFRSVGGMERREIRVTVVHARDASSGRPVAIGWNEVARFLVERYTPALRVEPRNEKGRIVVHFATVASTPHLPLAATEVVSEGDGTGLGAGGCNEHSWALTLRQDDAESRPGSGAVGGAPVSLTEPLTVVFAVDEQLTTATYGKDYVFVNGYGGAVLPPLKGEGRGKLSWKVGIPAGARGAAVYARFLPDSEQEGWEQVVVELVRTHPARVGIGWSSKARWLIEDD